MSERDPKVEPAPGDVLRRGKITRKVAEIRGQIVLCLEVHTDGFVRMVGPFLFQWRRWAAQAKVVQCNEKREVSA